MEVHDIADLAGRIGRGLMEQVFTTCRVAIVYDWDTFNSKNTDTFQAALGTLPEAIGIYEAIYNNQHPDDDELSEVAADKLATLFPKGTIARRVRLRAWFDTATRRNRSKTFEISEDSEHGFQDVPRHICDAMRRFLEENNITKKEPADGDT